MNILEAFCFHQCEENRFSITKSVTTLSPRKYLNYVTSTELQYLTCRVDLDSIIHWKLNFDWSLESVENALEQRELSFAIVQKVTEECLTKICEALDIQVQNKLHPGSSGIVNDALMVSVHIHTSISNYLSKVNMAFGVILNRSIRSGIDLAQSSSNSLKTKIKIITHQSCYDEIYAYDSWISSLLDCISACNCDKGENSVLVTLRPAIPALALRNKTVITNAKDWLDGTIFLTTENIKCIDTVKLTKELFGDSLVPENIITGLLVADSLFAALNQELEGILSTHAGHQTSPSPNLANLAGAEDFREFSSLSSNPALLLKWSLERILKLYSNAENVDDIQRWARGKVIANVSISTLSRAQRHMSRIEKAIRSQNSEKCDEVGLLQNLAAIGNVPSFLSQEHTIVKHMETLNGYLEWKLGGLPLKCDRSRAQYATYTKLLTAQASGQCGVWPSILLNISQEESYRSDPVIYLHHSATDGWPQEYSNVMRDCRGVLIQFLSDNSIAELITEDITFGGTNRTVVRSHRYVKSARIPNSSTFFSHEETLTPATDELPSFSVFNTPNGTFSASLDSVQEIVSSIQHSGIRLAALAVVLLVGGKHISATKGLTLMGIAIAEVLGLTQATSTSKVDNEFLHLRRLYLEVLGHCIMVNEATNQVLTRDCQLHQNGNTLKIPTLQSRPESKCEKAGVQSFLQQFNGKISAGWNETANKIDILIENLKMTQ